MGQKWRDSYPQDSWGSAGHCTWRADPIHHAETHGKARPFCALCVPANQKMAMSMRIHKPFPRFLARRALRGSAKRPEKDSVSVRVKRRHVMIPHSRGATWTSDAEWSQGGNQRHCETPRKPLAFPWGDAPDPAPFSMRGRYLDVNSRCLEKLGGTELGRNPRPSEFRPARAESAESAESGVGLVPPYSIIYANSHFRPESGAPSGAPLRPRAEPALVRCIDVR